MIGRRLPASSSFVLTAARLRALQLDPGPRDGQKTAATRKSHETVSPSPATTPRSPGQIHTPS